MATASPDRGRITARVPLQIQQTLEMAADMAGTTINQFIVQTALREAERIIEQERLIRLGTEDAAAFLSALESSLPPNAALKAALENYTERRNDQTGSLDWAPRPKQL